MCGRAVGLPAPHPRLLELPLGLAVFSFDGASIQTTPRDLVGQAQTKTARFSQKERAGFASGPEALGNGGVSSREDTRILPL
jgi:hypothetical protein